MKYVKPEIISIKKHPEFNEKWLQGKIEEDPSIVGLGDLLLRGSEKRIQGGGRLDTLLYDPEDNRRYEVEIQLGKTDESHIIRTIEYWDIERRRNPQYEHCAVIIAEDITSRFLNVISLFNGFIPLIAIQVKAVQIGDTISLFFTTVLDELRLDLNEEDLEKEITDRSYWEVKASKSSLKLVDKYVNEFVSPLTADHTPKFNKHYIGLGKQGVANNFVSFLPRKIFAIINVRLDKSEELDQIIENSGLDTLSYDKQWRQYRFKITNDDFKSNHEVMNMLTKKSFEEYWK